MDIPFPIQLPLFRDFFCFVCLSCKCLRKRWKKNIPNKSSDVAYRNHYSDENALKKQNQKQNANRSIITNINMSKGKFEFIKKILRIYVFL